MPDIVHDLPINAVASRVFRAVSMPAELDHWWTARSAGKPRLGAEYELWFGPEYDWRATVTRCEPDVAFELTLSHADKEWVGTQVGFHGNAKGGATQVCFHHLGWPAASEHNRVSCYCWAMYLRVSGAISSTESQCPTSGASMSEGSAWHSFPHRRLRRIDGHDLGESSSWLVVRLDRSNSQLPSS